MKNELDFSNFLFQNHSVSRDRLGVIKHLCHDSDFKVYIIHYEAKKNEMFFSTNHVRYIFS